MEDQGKWWKGKAFGACIMLVAALLAVQLVPGYFGSQTATLHLGNGTFSARVASSEKARVKGLSGTASLPRHAAMLFDFEHDYKWGIWMKDMHYPLDIVWLDESKHVVDMALGVSPASYPKVFTPKKDARYVIELPAGTVEKEAIREGQQAVFAVNWRAS